MYDTVSNLSWSVDIRKHGIVSVIEGILAKPWQISEEVGRSVPLALVEEDCVVSGLNLSFKQRSAEIHGICRNVIAGSLAVFPHRMSQLVDSIIGLLHTYTRAA